MILVIWNSKFWTYPKIRQSQIEIMNTITVVWSCNSSIWINASIPIFQYLNSSFSCLQFVLFELETSMHWAPLDNILHCDVWSILKRLEKIIKGSWNEPKLEKKCMKSQESEYNLEKLSIVYLISPWIKTRWTYN